MKIGIDVSQIVYETGVSRYTKNLVEALLKIDGNNQYLLFAGSLRRKAEIEKFYKSLKYKNVSGVVYPLPPTFFDFLWNRLSFINIESLIGNLDVFHSSDWTQPPSDAKLVTTIHDLTPVLYPEWSLPELVSVHTKRLARVKRLVETIIVPTKATKKDLLGLDFKNRIAVIPEAIDSRFVPANKEQIQMVKDKYEIESEFLLAVGVNPRKNTDRIIDSFIKLKRKEKNLHLVIVGYSHELVRENPDVIYTGHVDDDDMPALYSGAACLVYPSLYEGFGLPILEAMACSTAVVTSNISSMPEVAGGAAILVNPKSVDSIADGVIDAMERREDLINRGNNNIKRYSWEITAKKTLDIYTKQ